MLCSHSMTKQQVPTTFTKADYVRQVTANKSYKDGECGLFEHLLWFLLVGEGGCLFGGFLCFFKK